uniref:Uncharacterized protein n=1 Tax=Bos mutus grunniens TaxID=30521 RepID=A0A8B9YQQ1_BOSMU
ESTEIAPPAHICSGLFGPRRAPAVPPKCWSTLLGTGRCWPTRILRSTCALDVNVALHKIANLLKPDKEIVQEGDHMIIRMLSTFRNYIVNFQVGKEFEEDLTGIDDRKCMTTWVRWCTVPTASQDWAVLHADGHR